MVMGIFNAIYIAYMLIKYFSSSADEFKKDVLWYFVAFVRTTLLLMTCEFQKIVKVQKRDAFNYGLLCWSDIFWVMVAGVAMQMPELWSISIE